MTIPRADRHVTLLLCGSFNPITVLHLRICEAARDALKAKGVTVDKLIISPVHAGYGKETLISSEHRLAMARRAVQASKSGDWMQVSSWECEQEGWTRTLAVLQHFQQCEDDIGQKEGREGNQVMLLMGADVLEAMVTTTTWKDADRIILEHGIVSVVRGSGMAEIIKEHVPEDQKAHIVLADDGVVNNVSSSLVRSKVAQGKSIKYLVLDSIINYIAENGLYRGCD